MRTNKGLKIELKEIPNKNFDEFIKIFGESKNISQDKINIIEEYSNKVNKKQKTLDKVVNIMKKMCEESIESDKFILDSIIKQIKTPKYKKEFTIEQIKELDGVEDCFMDGNDKLCIVLKERKHEHYRGRDGHVIEFPYIMPSYTVTYLFKKIKKISFEESLQEKFKVLLESNRLIYTVKLTNYKDHISMISREDAFLFDNIDEYMNRTYQSPYQHEVSEINIEKYNGCGAVCFGNDNSYQAENLNNFDLVAHLVGLIDTLYTEDTTGHGYSTWNRIISYEKSVYLTQELKKYTENFYGFWQFFLCPKRIESNINIIIFDNNRNKILLKNGDTHGLSKINFYQEDVKSLDVKKIEFYDGDYKIDIKHAKSIIINDKEFEIKKFTKKLKEIYESIINTCS